MRKYKSTFILLFLLVGCSIASLFIGVIELGVGASPYSLHEQMEILLISRLPRLLAILCTGIGMSVAGLIMQQLLTDYGSHDFFCAVWYSAGTGLYAFVNNLEQSDFFGCLCDTWHLVVCLVYPANPIQRSGDGSSGGYHVW